MISDICHLWDCQDNQEECEKQKNPASQINLTAGLCYSLNLDNRSDWLDSVKVSECAPGVFHVPLVSGSS